jgi:hypothetical protein
MKERCQTIEDGMIKELKDYISIPSQELKRI